jgi:uncharacterized coiled-coil DUF342 family protein
MEGTKKDKAAGVSTPTTFNPSDEAIKNAAITEVCTLRDQIEELKAEIKELKKEEGFSNSAIVSLAKERDELKVEVDQIKNDFIQITKAFCLVK